MGTPAGAPTTGLLQATRYLKDNRLLPRGFDKRTADPEIAVLGAAAADADFTGDGDRVRYRFPSAPAATVEVELRYQPIGYRWARTWRPTTRASRAGSSATTTRSPPRHRWSSRAASEHPRASHATGASRRSGERGRV